MRQFQDDWTRTREVETDASRASNLAVQISKLKLLMEEVAEWTRLTDQVKQNVKELNLRMDRMQEVEDGRYIYRIVREMVTPPGFLPGLIVLADDTIRPAVQQERQQHNSAEIRAPRGWVNTDVAILIFQFQFPIFPSVFILGRGVQQVGSTPSQPPTHHHFRPGSRLRQPFNFCNTHVTTKSSCPRLFNPVPATYQRKRPQKTSGTHSTSHTNDFSSNRRVNKLTRPFDCR
jgi:hypothetical protein